MTRLPASFYDQPVLVAARELLGCTLRHGDTAGIIVETEAYHHSEPSCHAHAGMTPRATILWQGPAVAYVYRSYGIHALFNAVCEAPGVGAAVLVRALEPTEGLHLMAERRPRAKYELELCNGPGKLTQALGIGLDLNGTSLVDGPIVLERRAEAPPHVCAPRIGISVATDLPWRFCVAGSPWVSRPWPRELT